MGKESQLFLAVAGMTCGHCVMAVKKALYGVDGVKSAEVTLDPPRAIVTFDPDRTGVEALRAAIVSEGYSTGP